MAKTLTGPVLLPQNEAIDKALIFLHGYGSNGDDLISLAPEFQSKHTGYFSPHAPSPTVMGMGYEWFSDNNQTFIDKSGMEKTLILLEDYLADIHEKYNVPYNKMVLVGFSQGTMMSLYAAPRLQHKIAGVIGFSGRLMWQEELEGTSYHKTPIILIHGEADDVVPVKDSPQAAEKLTKLGFDVEVHTIPYLPHGIDGKAIGFAKAWLKKILAE
jgi:phospholipase/carboxylesterase